MKLSKKTGTYDFPNNGLTYDNLKTYLTDNGYEEKPFVKGRYDNEFEKAQYIGKRCYFTYREAYSSLIVVTNEDNDFALGFYLGLYGVVTMLYVIGENGRSRDKGVDVDKNPDDAAKIVKSFFRIR